jgi:tetratricopeptide (TPR) repeat protein
LKQLARADADLSEAIARGNEEAWVWRERGSARAALDRGAEADADFREAFRRDPDDYQARAWHALLRWRARDLFGHLKAGADLLRASGKSDDVEAVEHVAWALVRAPGMVPDRGRPVALAEKAVVKDPGNVNYVGTLGAALYRAGRHDEAVKRLEKALALRTDDSREWDWLFLAMAHHRLGHTDEAKVRLKQAVERLDDSARRQALDWWMRKELDLIRREAEGVLKQPAGPSGK